MNWKEKLMGNQEAAGGKAILRKLSIDKIVLRAVK